MSIYYELIKRVEDGEPFNINFEERSMKVGKQYLIKNGEFEQGKKLMEMSVDFQSVEDVLKYIEEQYEFYKFSLPSERCDSKRKKYFKALSIDEIDDERLLCAGVREVEQARLEGFILCSILNGKLKWNDAIMGGKWFWQSKTDPDLVILKKWIENK